jgi:hypothetical protein
VLVEFSGGVLAHQPISNGGGLCIGEEIIGAPMWRWKKICVQLVCYVSAQEEGTR